MFNESAILLIFNSKDSVQSERKLCTNGKRMHFCFIWRWSPLPSRHCHCYTLCKYAGGV